MQERTRLQYVSHLAPSSQCQAVCRRWPALLASLCLFFLQVSTLHHSEAGGDIKAIWSTFSDLPKWHEGLCFHMHAQYTQTATELTRGLKATEGNTVQIFLALYRERDPCLLLKQRYLCTSKPGALFQFSILMNFDELLMKLVNFQHSTVTDFVLI